MREIHFTLLNPRDWHWPNFKPSEIACKGTGLILIDKEFMDRLQLFRNIVKVPVIINSAYRSESHNRAVGGAKNSQHRLGKASDVRITPQLTRDTIHQCAKIAGFTGFGDYNTFVHIDIGPERYWDERT